MINYDLRRRPRLAGVAASSPWLRLAFEPPALKVRLGRVTNRLWPAFSQSSGPDVRGLSRDPEAVQAYTDDPLVHDRISARLFVGVYEAGLRALDHAAEFGVPLLVMHGDADRLTSPEASRRFASGVTGDCTFKLWEGFYHELHNEPGKEEVFDFLASWLRSKIK